MKETKKLKILLGNSSVKRGTPSECYHTDSNPSTGGGGSNISDVGTNVDSNNQPQTIHSQQQQDSQCPSQQDQQQQCDEAQIVSHHQHVTQITHQQPTQMTHITFVDDESSCDSRWGKRFRISRWTLLLIFISIKNIHYYITWNDLFIYIHILIVFYIHTFCIQIERLKLKLLSYF